MKRSIPCRAVAACAIAIAFTFAAGVPAGHSKNGDTHITGEGLEQTVDCNGATLLATAPGTPSMRWGPVGR